MGQGEKEMGTDTTKSSEESIIHESIQRRDFLKGAAFSAVGMLPIATLLGCSSKARIDETVDEASVESFNGLPQKSFMSLKWL